MSLSYANFATNQNKIKGLDNLFVMQLDQLRNLIREGMFYIYEFDLGWTEQIKHQNHYFKYS